MLVEKNGPFVGMILKKESLVGKIVEKESFV